MLISTIAHTLAFPKSYGVTEGLAFDTITKIRSKYGTELSFVYKNFTNKALFKEIKELLNPLTESTNKIIIDIFRAIDFIIVNDKDLLELNRYESCKLECCNYA
jgi:hypothetical protein